MPEASQYTFTHQEVLTLLVKSAGLHEGRWMLLVTFGFTAGNFGPDDKNMMPGAILGIQQFGLTKATPESPEGLVVDAAEVNPRKK